MLGDWRDALFLGILVSNAGIGIVQEVRAKRALDRSPLSWPDRDGVVRDGRPRRLHVADVVEEPIAGRGRRSARRGRRPVETAGLRLDESVLTGESEPVSRAVGNEVRSGSFAVEGAASRRHGGRSRAGADREEKPGGSAIRASLELLRSGSDLSP